MAENNHVVRVNITFRNTEATDALRNYATEKITHCLNKFIHQDVEVHTVLKVEKNTQVAEVTFHANGADFKCSQESESLYTSIDNLVDTMMQQLRKHKEKLQKR
jgi:putative sigma-54 modulation protein